MTTRCVPGLLLLALSLTSARSATYRVSPSPPGPAANGLSWATAFPTVQQGIDAAEIGDEVWVAAGTYQEGKTITLKSGVGLYGGFAGTETERSQRDPAASATVLDGEAKVTVVSIPATADSRTVLDGFTIRNGLAPNTTGKGGTGGGVYIGGGTPIVSNNTITLCGAQGARTVAGSYGGGIYVAAGTPLISWNSISWNSAMFGGGIYAKGGLIRDNTVANNSAGHAVLGYGWGGGIALSNHAVAVHNVVTGNQAPGLGGGGGGVSCEMGILVDNLILDNQGTLATDIWGLGTDTIVRNTIVDAENEYGYNQVSFQDGTFSDNLMVADPKGNGLRLDTSTAIYHTAPIIANNTITTLATGLNPRGYGVVSTYIYAEKPVFANNIIVGWKTAGFTGNSGTDPTVFTTDHNDVYSNTDNTLKLPGASQVGENGTISADPLFVDAVSGDYRLQAGSPCIDAGNDATVTSGDRDLLGAPRIAGAHVDIGCYEYGSPAWTMLDAAEVLRVAAGLSLASPAEVSRLDVVAEDGATGPNLTVLDATRIAQWLLN